MMKELALKLIELVTSQWWCSISTLLAEVA